MSTRRVLAGYQIARRLMIWQVALSCSDHDPSILGSCSESSSRERDGAIQADIKVAEGSFVVAIRRIPQGLHFCQGTLSNISIFLTPACPDTSLFVPSIGWARFFRTWIFWNDAQPFRLAELQLSSSQIKPNELHHPLHLSLRITDQIFIFQQCILPLCTGSVKSSTRSQDRAQLAAIDVEFMQMPRSDNATSLILTK
jgi:hypothetical protein